VSSLTPIRDALFRLIHQRFNELSGEQQAGTIATARGGAAAAGGGGQEEQGQNHQQQQQQQQQQHSTYVEIEDESALHQDHYTKNNKMATNTQETHMHVKVASTLFKGKTELQRQTMVNSAVMPVFSSMGLHALRISTNDTLPQTPKNTRDTTSNHAKTTVAAATATTTTAPPASAAAPSSSSSSSLWLDSHRDVLILIESLIRSYPVLLFMKGDKVTPRCGFSRQAISMIETYSTSNTNTNSGGNGNGNSICGVSKKKIVYHTVDILKDQLLRQGLKEYSKWPTYPQLYVKGKLLGGIDVMKALDAKGELKPLLESANR